MKTYQVYIIILAGVFIFLGFGMGNFSFVDEQTVTVAEVDTVRPLMELMGRAVDTAYLNSVYQDPQVRLLDEVNGVLRRTDIELEISGQVDTRFPGSYVLQYNAKDHAGNSATALTRTVHVVAGEMTEMYGTYAAVCTCTAIERGCSSPTITTCNYQATVIPGARKQCFDLNTLKIGPQFVKPASCVNNNTIEVSFFSADVHPRSAGTGTLSVSKNSFTVETTAYQWSPTVNYFCRNVFTQLRLTEIKK